MAQTPATPRKPARKFVPLNDAHESIVEAAKLISKGAKTVSLAQLVQGRRMLDEGLRDFLQGGATQG